jgi:predicted molibdopterin-dependent oxidoreductase YjgC
MIRREGGLVPVDWETALKAVLSGLRKAAPLGGILSGRSTNEEAFLFARLLRRLSDDARLEVWYRERGLTPVERILKSPDRSANFRGAREMGVSSGGGLESLIASIASADVRGAYIVGEDLLSEWPDARAALENLAFLVVQESRMTPTAELAHVLLPATHFGEKDGTYTNRKGRVQRLRMALVPPENAMQDWEIFARLLEGLGDPMPVASPAEIFEEIAREIPGYDGLNYDDVGLRGAQTGAPNPK